MPFNKKHYEEQWKNKDWTPDTATMRHYTSFDDYVKDFPEGEHFRAWITSDAKDKLVIFESRWQGFSGWLPGGFYWVHNAPSYVNYKGITVPCRIFVEGSDDGCLSKNIDCDQVEHEFEEIMTIEHRDMSWFEQNGYEYGD